MVSFIKDVAKYLSIFRKHIGYRIYIVFILTAMAAGTEAFGISLLLPLIEIADAGVDGETSKITQILQSFLAIFGIDQSMIGILIFIGLVFITKGAIKFSEMGYKSYLAAELHKEIKGMLFSYYSNMDYNYYNKHNTGHFINVITGQVNKLINAFESFKKFLSEIIITISYLLFAFIVSWQFALMAVFAGILLFFIFGKLNVYVKELSRKSSKEQSTLNKFLIQTLHAFKYLSSTNQFAHLRKGVMLSIYKLSKYLRNKGLAMAMTSSVKEPVSIVLIITIIIFQIHIFNAPLAPILVSLILIHRSMGHIVLTQKSWQTLMNNIGGLEMVESELADVKKFQQKSGSIKLGAFAKEINIKDLSFAYDIDEGDVLQSLNLTIPANTTVAFVGESGAGKSTFVDILTLLLKPQKGEFYIDGINHKNIDLKTWRKQIGYVSQDTVVFDDTVANNICLWKGDYNKNPELRSKIEIAAQKAYAIEFINELPNGFQTIVGDRGVRLSGGQKQRLFIARELFKNPRFLILDEATSALDSESEKFIQQSIDGLKGYTTVAIIAHRLSTIKDVDNIYVLENGRIVEQGNYETLTSRESSFSRMVKLQSL